MKRYRVEITFGSSFHQTASSLFCENEANIIAEMAASSDGVKEVRIIEIETVTTETEIRRFPISEND